MAKEVYIDPEYFLYDYANSDQNLVWSTSTAPSPVPPSSPHSTAFVVIISIIMAVVSLVTVFGNLLVLLAFYLDKSIRQPSNYFILSLAISDLIIGLEGFPFYSLYVLRGNNWPLGWFACDFWLAVDYSVCLASIYTVLFITIDRFCSVQFATAYRKWRTKPKIRIIIVVIWSVPTILFSTAIFGWSTFTGSRILQEWECEVQFMLGNPILNMSLYIVYYWTTLVVMIILYGGIYRTASRLHKKSQQKRKKMSLLHKLQGAAPELSSHQESPSNKSRLDPGTSSSQASPREHERSSSIVTSDLDFDTREILTSSIDSSGLVQPLTLPAACNLTPSPLLYRSKVPKMKKQMSLHQIYEKKRISIVDARSAFRNVFSSSSRLGPAPISQGGLKSSITGDNLMLKTPFDNFCFAYSSNNQKPESVTTGGPLRPEANGSAAHTNDTSEERLQKETLQSSLACEVWDGTQVETPSAENKHDGDVETSHQARSISMPPAAILDGGPSTENRNGIIALTINSSHSFDATSDDMWQLPSLTTDGTESTHVSKCSLRPAENSVPTRQPARRRILPRSYSEIPANALPPSGRSFSLQMYVPNGAGQQSGLGLLNVRNAEGTRKTIRKTARRRSRNINPQKQHSSSTKRSEPSTLDDISSDWSSRRELHTEKQVKFESEKGAANYSQEITVSVTPSVVTEENDVNGNTMQNHGATFGRRLTLQPKTVKRASTDSTTKSPETSQLLEATSDSERRRSSTNQRAFDGSKIRELIKAHKKTPKQSRSENRAKKALRTITIILGAFALFWTPFYVMATIYGFCASCVPPELFICAYYMCYMNSPINPFCYALANAQFRKTFLRILKFDFHKS